MSINKELLQGQVTIFDFLDSNFFKDRIIDSKEEKKVSFEDMLKEILLSYGTGFELGRYRVHRILQRTDMAEKEKISAIKKEFGCGGMGKAAEINHINQISTIGSDMEVAYLSDNGIVKVNLSWKKVYDYIKKWDERNEYYNASFEPKDLKITNHLYFENALFLKISEDSNIYNKGMEGKNLFIVYKEKKFSLVSVINGKSEPLLLTMDEENIIKIIGYKYGWDSGKKGIWNLCQQEKEVA